MKLGDSTEVDNSSIERQMLPVLSHRFVLQFWISRSVCSAEVTEVECKGEDDGMRDDMEDRTLGMERFRQAWG